jgi:hypothetical protein
MSDSIKPVDTAPLLVAGNLQLRITTLHDRHGHVIEASVDSSLVTLLESVEGDASQPWPPSPALQSLDITELECGPVALLVGMAGQSHWSASYEARTNEGSLVLDWACRSSREPSHLGTTYRLNDNVQVELASDTSGEIVWGSSRWPIKATHGRLSLEDGRLSVVPTAPAGKQSPRWAMRVG